MNPLNLYDFDLPHAWAIEKLSNFVDIIMGQSPPSDTYNTNGEGLPFFQGKAEFGVIYPTVTKYCSEPNKIASQGDVLLSIRAPVGPTNLAPLDCCIGRGLAALHPLDSISSKFILYLFRALEPQISKEGTGSTFKAINKQFIENLTIALPPLQEQIRIINKIEENFSDLDKGIEYLRTAKEQLKVYRQSVLKYAFEGKLTEQWREFHISKLETADQLLERIQQEGESRYQQQLNEWEEVFKVWEENGKEGKKPGKPQMPFNTSSLTEEELVNLPDLPESWCWIKLSVLSERIQIGPFGSLLHRSDYVSNQVPIVNPVHIRNQKIEPDWSLTVTKEKVNELSNYIMYPGDIVMGRRGEMGRCAVISHEESGFLCGSGSLFIRLLPSINPLFYCYLLGSQRLKNYLSDQSVGTTMQNLNQEIIHNLPVPLCSPIEIQKIIEEVDRRTTLITEVENIIEENLLASEILKQSILKNAFSGQLIPQGSGDENAAVLLERIREARRHQEDHQVPIPKPRKQVAMKKDLSIIEVLQELNGLATAQDVWRRSKYQEDIEGFYAELKKQINNGVIEEVENLREEKKSYLRLRNEN
ncbi:restriction endonuclease subunit S [Microcoleus sp.]|uniref:restriction endonuclease subunit S n=1 Tax=Microcoleus sp. TaxID=44472 RepID=UPI00352385D3